MSCWSSERWWPLLLERHPTASAKPKPEAGPTVYVGELTHEQLKQLSDLGLDRSDLSVRQGATKDSASVEVVLSRRQAAKLNGLGLNLHEKKVVRHDSDRAAQRQRREGYTVFRSYSEAGGIKDELVDLALHYPKLVKLVTIGKTVQGQNILALKVTKNATQLAGRQSARRALLRGPACARVDHAGDEPPAAALLRRQLRSNPAIQHIVDTTELWFVPVANPDGYDYTFTEGNRLWRKNLRDNDGDGVITGNDGVDPNRNFPTSGATTTRVLRRPSPARPTAAPPPTSEPETQALDGLMSRISFKFLVNYHSAAELLLYGVGWQVATPTPDDLIYEALAGDDAKPAIPGYDPDIAAELYTTNGETNDHAHNRYGTLAFTPEMSTCETASASDPDDAFDPEDCHSGFNFPDSEPLVQAEFEKNIPFALSVAKSAQHPDDPVSVVGRTAPTSRSTRSTCRTATPRRWRSPHAARCGI